jgi:hypothetical protein
MPPVRNLNDKNDQSSPITIFEPSRSPPYPTEYILSLSAILYLSQAYSVQTQLMYIFLVWKYYAILLEKVVDSVRLLILLGTRSPIRNVGSPTYS